MTDVTSHIPARGPTRRGQQREYQFYFGLIFLTALPFACLSCLWDVLVGKRPASANPLGRARREAARIAPSIFSA